jgi:pSer/pThr/pTyr-binding forkhead associated (FHA) protein
LYRIVARDAAGAEVGWYEIDEATGSILVGRSPESHILLDHPGVSREHVFFYVQEGEVVVEDNGSAVGTLVDGYPAEEPLFVGPEHRIDVGPFTVEILPLEGSSVAVDEGFQHDAQAVGVPAVVGADPAFDPTLKPKPGLFKLVAISGLTAGTETPLSWQEDIDIGRDEELEIPLQDPTVSRRHARMRITEQGVLVIDLRSMNGTFLNGERVKRQEATQGDRVRFGEVAFELQAASARELAAQQEGGSKVKLTRKHLILAGGGAMIVLALLVVGLMAGGPEKKAPTQQKQRTTSVDSKLQRKFRTAIANARTAMNKRDWEKAKRILESTQDIFARHETRDKLLQQVNEEMHFASILEKGNQLYEGATTLENYRKARDQYELIQPTSDYYGEARMKLEKVRIWLAKYYLTEGLTYAKARRLKNRMKAAKYLCKYFALLPEYYRPEGNEEMHRQRLQRLEKRIKRFRRKYETCQAKRYLNPEVGADQGAATDALAELKKKHQLKPLVQAILLYYKGKLDESIGRVQKLQDNRRLRRHRVMLNGVYNKLTYIKGQYNAGTGFLQGGKLREAQDAFDKALAKDAELIPPTLESHVKQEAGRQLADAYLERGQREYSRSRYQDAYRFWHRGKQANQNHVGIKNALLKLEAVARNWLNEAQSLADANKADEAKAKFQAIRRITEPGSRYYTDATQALADLKRGR